MIEVFEEFVMIRVPPTSYPEPAIPSSVTRAARLKFNGAEIRYGPAVGNFTIPPLPALAASIAPWIAAVSSLTPSPFAP